MLALGPLVLLMLALELLVPPCQQLVLDAVGVGRHHLAVAAVLAAHLLMLAPGLLVLTMLTLGLLVVLCQQLVLDAAGAGRHHPAAYRNLLLVACSSLVGLMHLPWCQLLVPLARLVQCSWLPYLWLVSLLAVGLMVGLSVFVYTSL